MKKLILLFTGLLIVTIASSQVRFGIRGGISSSSLAMDDINPNDLPLDNKALHAGNAKVGLHIGAMSQIAFLGMFIQPEILFTSLRNEIEVETIIPGSYPQFETSTNKINRIDIPIVVGAKMGPLRIGIGPVASRILNSDSEVKDILFPNNDGTNNYVGKTTWGYQIALGLDLSKIAFDLKYEGSLGNLGDGFSYGGKDYNFDSRPKQLIFSLGYYFN